MEKKHRGPVLDRKDGAAVIDCKNCGFAHVWPLPTDPELRKLYEDDFYQHEKPKYFSETKEDLPWWMATYDNYYRIFEKHTEGRTLLDVGSGPGHFLACGKKRGWITLGIEPSLPAVRYTRRRGLNAVQDFFSYERAKQYGSFDVVHASLVLEHVPDPITFIIDMKKLLKPGGLIAIFCPNDYNPLQIILKSGLGWAPWWVTPHHHLNYFSFRSIKALLESRGFTVEEMLGTFPLELFLLSGRKYVGHPSLGRQCHSERKKFELAIYKHNPELLNDIYRDLGKRNVGREFFIVGRKGNGRPANRASLKPRER